MRRYTKGSRGQQPDDKKANADLKALQGTWRGTSLIFDGDDIPKDVASKQIFKIDAGKAKVLGGLANLNGMYVATARTTEYRIVLGKAGDLHTIDLVEPKEGGRKIPGIYKLEKGKLTMCLNYKNADRPKSFESKADSGVGVYEMEQAKKDN